MAFLKSLVPYWLMPLEETFTLKNGLQLLVKGGDITSETAGGVVVGEDENFSGYGAVAQALLDAGGKEYKWNRDRLRDYIREEHPHHLVYSCPAGKRLNYKHVLHAIASYNGKLPKDWISHLKCLFFEMGRVAEREEIFDLVTPLLGAGLAQRPLETVVWAAIEGLSILEPKVLRRVTILEYEREKAEIIKENVKRILFFQVTPNDPVENGAHTSGRQAEDRPNPMRVRTESTSSYVDVNLQESMPDAAGDADINEGNSFLGQRKRIVQQHTRRDEPDKGDEEFPTAQHKAIMGEGEEESAISADRGQRKSKAHRNKGSEVPNIQQEEPPPSIPGGDTDHDADFRFRGQRKSKTQEPREDAAVSHQRSPSSPDPVLDRPADFAAGDADINEGNSFLGQRKRIVQQHARRDEPGKEDEEFPTAQHKVIMGEGEKESAVSADRGQRKSKALRNKGPEVPITLQEEPPPSTRGGDRDFGVDSYFRGQRKSKAQVPREDATDSHQRSSSSPDPVLDRGLPLDTSTMGRGTEGGIVEEAFQTWSLGQDSGTEQRKGKLGNAELAAGNTGRDSDTAKSSDKETLRGIIGSMPEGTMSHTANPRIHIPGFEGCGVIVVDYDIPDGIQKSEHPQPGSPYSGCAHRTFLPDNDEGRRVLGLLEEAFDRRLTFQVYEQPGGQAVVEWADIPHKTCLRGTRDRGGYPDPDYLETVRGILREKYGIE